MLDVSLRGSFYRKASRNGKLKCSAETVVRSSEAGRDCHRVAETLDRASELT